MSKRGKIRKLKKLIDGKQIEDWKSISPEDHYYSYFYFENPRKFRKRYRLAIGGDLLAGCASIALVTVLVVLTYLSKFPMELATRVFYSAGLILGLLFGLAKIEVLYGRIHWVWINVAIYILCLLISLPAIAYRPNLYLYALSLLSPLVGLLILNSNRCRELRHKMVEIRRKREERIALLKQPGKWK